MIEGDKNNNAMSIAFNEAFVKEALQNMADNFVKGFKEFIGDGIYIGNVSKEELIDRQRHS